MALVTPDRPVLVVDDDIKIVTLVRTYLEREGMTVATAFDGPSALDLIERLRPSLVVLDLMLPELDGLAVMRAVRGDEDAAATPILVLSARGGTAERVEGLANGADDYLAKPFSPMELVLRVKAIIRRTSVGSDRAELAVGASEPVLAHGDLVLDPARHEVVVAGRLVPLTLVEFKILHALLAANGRVLTRDHLLDAVYGNSGIDVLDRTIDVHVGRLREKLVDDPDNPRYVATVRGVGYRAARLQPEPRSNRVAS